MSRQGAHIVWFLAVSAVLHAAVLLIGARHEPSLAPAGPLVHVSMRYRAAAAGHTSVPTATDAVAEPDSRAAMPHVRAKPPAPPQAARKAASGPPEPLPHDAVADQQTGVRQPGKASNQDTPAAPTAGVGADPAGAEEQLRRRVLRLVSSRFDYPLMARRKGMEGVVRLQVRIEPDGRISNLRVNQTSGYPVLDRAALQSLQLASVPDAQQWLNGQAIDIIIPVEYRLVGG